MVAASWSSFILENGEIQGDTYQNLGHTVWKFQDFSVTYILREIKFGNFRRSKSAILATLENSPFFESVRNSQNLKILCHKKGQRDSL